MKKIITVIAIFAVSLFIGFSWSKIEDFVTVRFYPVKYYDIVEKYSQEYSVPPEIILGVIRAESSFVADAVSYKGAVGLMQLMPSTYEWLSTKINEEANESFLYDPNVNIKYGTYYLSYLYSRFGVWETVYAAYNAGDTRVKTWLEDEKYGLDGRLINIPFEETATYVEKVKKNVKIYKELLDKESE